MSVTPAGKKPIELPQAPVVAQAPVSKGAKARDTMKSAAVCSTAGGSGAAATLGEKIEAAFSVEKKALEERLGAAQKEKDARSERAVMRDLSRLQSAYDSWKEGGELQDLSIQLKGKPGFPPAEELEELLASEKTIEGKIAKATEVTSEAAKGVFNTAGSFFGQLFTKAGSALSTGFHKVGDLFSTGLKASGEFVGNAITSFGRMLGNLFGVLLSKFPSA